jgi:hypothetical protein
VRALAARGVPRIWLFGAVTKFGGELTPPVRTAIELRYTLVRTIAASGSFFDHIVEYQLRSPGPSTSAYNLSSWR